MFFLPLKQSVDALDRNHFQTTTGRSYISRSRSVKLVYFGFLFSIRIKTNGLFIASFKITKAISERMMANFQLLDFICLPAWLSFLGKGMAHFVFL